MADGGCCRNCRGRSGSEHGSDRINCRTGHNRNYAGNDNRNGTGYNHAGFNTDPGNDGAWNGKSDSRDRKSHAWTGNTGAGNNSGNSSDKSNT